MTVNPLFSFLIFTIFLFNFGTPFFQDLAVCGDCTEQNKGKCIIEGEPGYFVSRGLFGMSNPNSEMDMTPSDFPPQTLNMSKCIPDGLAISAPVSYEYICVWSEEYGCQVIVPKSGDKVDCALCYSRGPDVDCPCVDLSSKLKAGSDQIRSISYLVIVGACVVSLVTYLWK
ncbi:uncharacterized protein LOC108108577 isoform X2 [Drosophila eugracilis]|uniref:uncharacterized protein LOC108108577 isoform X2 n=1 Tax=Drosophila eugracilis TaxID=29029 RepID=UPI0007E703CB|nr:uncharacterized protein LOC108108577 isoform X2 [Drosophila eugracilis]